MLVATRAIDVGGPDPQQAAIADSLAQTMHAIIADGVNRLDTAAMGRFYARDADVRIAEAGRFYPSVQATLDSAAAFFARADSASFTLSDVTVNVLGRDAAVGTASWSGTWYLKTAAPMTYGGAWTVVFQRRDSAWMVVSEHSSFVPPAAPPAPARRR